MNYSLAIVCWNFSRTVIEMDVCDILSVGSVEYREGCKAADFKVGDVVRVGRRMLTEEMGVPLKWSKYDDGVLGSSFVITEIDRVKGYLHLGLRDNWSYYDIGGVTLALKCGNQFPYFILEKVASGY
jgi:hypothetical protein